jgi:hypothetical protein
MIAMTFCGGGTDGLRFERAGHDRGQAAERCLDGGAGPRRRTQLPPLGKAEPGFVERCHQIALLAVLGAYPFDDLGGDVGVVGLHGELADPG